MHCRGRPPISSLSSPNWNRVQTYSLQRVDMPYGRVTVLGTGLPCPPCNIRAAVRALQWDVVGNQCDRLRSVRTDERVYVRTVGNGILGDLGSLTMG